MSTILRRHDLNLLFAFRNSRSKYHARGVPPAMVGFHSCSPIFPHKRKAALTAFPTFRSSCSIPKKGPSPFDDKSYKRELDARLIRNDFRNLADVKLNPAWELRSK